MASSDVYLFPDLKGPSTESVIPAPQSPLLTDYANGSASRLAVLLTDPSAAWPGLAEGLKTIGIPFIITQDYQEALKHHVILVYPQLTGDQMKAEACAALANAARKGHTLIGMGVLECGTEKVFGIKETVTSKKRYSLQFTPAARAVYHLSDPRDARIPLGVAAINPDAFGSYAYIGAREPLATYDDGTPAIIHRKVGSGHAYAIGLDLGFFILKGHAVRAEEMRKDYMNGYEPSIDTFLRLLRQIYREREPDAVTIGTVPDGKKVAILLTHDLDAQQSMTNAVVYANFEKQSKIKATYFVQTKIRRDFSDEVFFKQETLPPMKKVQADGGELGSHSVAHSHAFHDFPIGDGKEQYPSYAPRVVDFNHAEGGTVFGELRISKFLIDSLLMTPEIPVVSFRAGHLISPPGFPQILEAVGYKYDASATAGNSLTHFPYYLYFNKEYAAPTSVLEFPLSFEDESDPPMSHRVPKALAIANKIATYGGQMVILIHPNILGPKLEFEEKFVAAMKPTAWFGTVSELGDWWNARYKIELDVSHGGTNRVVDMLCPVPIPIPIPVTVPSGWRLVRTEPDGLQVTHTQKTYLIHNLRNMARLVFRKEGE